MHTHTDTHLSQRIFAPAGVGFPGGVSHLAMQETDTGWIPGWGRSPGGGHSNPLQCSCLKNPMGRGAWRVTVHGVPKSLTRLKRLSKHAAWSVYMHTHTYPCIHMRTCTAYTCSHRHTRVHTQAHTPRPEAASLAESRGQTTAQARSGRK